MGLYTKTDKQIDIYYEMASINKSLSKQNNYLKTVVISFSIFNVFVIIKRIIQSIHNPITFSFR